MIIYISVYTINCNFSVTIKAMENRAYYRNNINDFITENPDNILGKLAYNHHFDLDIDPIKRKCPGLLYAKRSTARTRCT